MLLFQRDQLEGLYRLESAASLCNFTLLQFFLVLVALDSIYLAHGAREQ